MKTPPSGLTPEQIKTLALLVPQVQMKNAPERTYAGACAEYVARGV